MISVIFSGNHIFFYLSKDVSTQTFEGKISLASEDLFEKIKKKTRELKRLFGLSNTKMLLIHNSDTKYLPTIECIKDIASEDNELHIFIESSLSYTFLWSLIKSNSDNIILLDSLENNNGIFYHLPLSRQHQRRLNISHSGYSKVASSLKSSFQEDLIKLGYSTSTEDISEGRIVENLYKGLNELDIQKNGKYTSIKIALNIEKSLTDSIYQTNNKFLKNYINPELLSQSESVKIVLIGNYFKNAKTLNFLQTYLTEVNADYLTIYTEEEIFSMIARGAFKIAYFKEEEERKELLENKRIQVMSQEELVKRIQQEVKDPTKREYYINYFKEQAIEKNVPVEILIWHIENKVETLKISEELSQLKKSIEAKPLPIQFHDIEHLEETNENVQENPIKANELIRKKEIPSELNLISNELEESLIVDDEDDPVISISDLVSEEKKLIDSKLYDFDLPTSHFEKNDIRGNLIEDPTTTLKGNQPEKEIEDKINKDLSAFQVSDFSWPNENEDSLQLESIIDTERIFPNSEFILLKGTMKGSAIKRIFRIISINELSQVENLQNFRRLYERESNYYGDLSNIFRSNFGLFYYRKFIDGQLLAEYIKNLGLDQKQHLQDLDSNDFKLIFHLWKAIKVLDFSYSNFSENNIVVTKNSKDEIDIKLVGIRSEIENKDKMENKLHSIIGALLSPGVYDDFVKKFK